MEPPRAPRRGAPGSATRRSRASARVRTRPAGRSAQALLLRAADEMHAGGRIGDELWATAGARARRGPADRALHADRPLRDAGDDPELARSRARAAGTAVRPARSRRRRDLRGKRCLITGAASGIGRATALAAAARGADLYLTDVQAEALEETAAEVRGAGGTVASRRAGRPRRPRGRRRHGRGGPRGRTASMDVVMNIAGIVAWGTIERLEHEHWRQTIDVNLIGPIGVLECFVPPMIEAAPRRPHRQRLLGGGPLRPPLARALQRDQVRPARRLRGAALRPAPAPHRRQPRLPGRGQDAAGRHGRDRRRRPRRPGVRREIARFERHAVSPEHVAEKILDGDREEPLPGLHLGRRPAPALGAIRNVEARQGHHQLLPLPRQRGRGRRRARVAGGRDVGRRGRREPHPRPRARRLGDLRHRPAALAVRRRRPASSDRPADGPTRSRRPHPCDRHRQDAVDAEVLAKTLLLAGEAAAVECDVPAVLLERRADRHYRRPLMHHDPTFWLLARAAGSPPTPC